MKLFTKTLIAGALMMFVVPATAMAYDGCGWGYRPGYVYRDMSRDRHQLRYEQADLARDRYRLDRDLAYGNWWAARARRADINRDLNRMQWQRMDLSRDYQSFGY
jgi:hypothetical protein